MLTLRFGEPYSMDCKSKNNDVKLPKQMVLKMRNMENWLVYKSNIGNAYRFGPRYKLHKYKFLLGHGNDGAQTGFVDVTGATTKELNNLSNSDVWEEATGGFRFSWDAKDVLKKVQVVLPRVVFVGETVGGDVGANLYVHARSKDGVIDSLIIDNEYFFATNKDEFR